MKRVLTLFCAVMVVLVLFFIFLKKPVKAPEEKTVNTDDVVSVTQKVITATSTAKVNGYTIEFVHKMYSDDFPAGDEIIISKEDKILFVEDDALEMFAGYFSEEFGDWISSADQLKTKAFKDVTGDGKKELVFTSYSGGAHCCSHNYVIGLGDPLHFYLDLDTGDNGIKFIDLDHDGKLEIETNEDVFAYWNTSYAASPMPRVVLSLQNGAYKADPKFMYKKPFDAEIKAKAKAVTGWSGSTGPEVAWKYVLDLIYSGNIDLARKYVDLAWREGGEFKSKEEFWKELEDQIHQSPYYADLRSFFGI